MSDDSSTQIGIAVVEHNNCYLIGKRGNDGPLPGYAEFPGGKCNSEESPEECVLRECLEETGLSVVTVELLLNRPFTYAHGTVDLHFWLCRPEDPKDIHLNHHGFKWIPARELPDLNFPDANAPVIERIMNNG